VLSLKKIICASSDCGLIFYLCRRCFRGQSYCSEDCRARERAEQCLSAQRAYAETDNGREHRAKASSAYRTRQQTQSSAGDIEASVCKTKVDEAGAALACGVQTDTRDSALTTSPSTTRSMLREERAEASDRRSVPQARLHGVIDQTLPRAVGPEYSYQVMLFCARCGRPGCFRPPGGTRTDRAS
jgi:hypothetical protein